MSRIPTIDTDCPEETYRNRMDRRRRYRFMMGLSMATIPVGLIGLAILVASSSPRGATVGLALMAAPVLFFLIGWSERTPPITVGRCYHCGYDITGGGAGDRCAECGGRLAAHVGPRFMGAADAAARAAIAAAVAGEPEPLVQHGMAPEQADAAIEMLRRYPAPGKLDFVAATPGPQCHICHYVTSWPGQSGRLCIRVWVGEHQGDPHIRGLQVVASGVVTRAA